MKNMTKKLIVLCTLAALLFLAGCPHPSTPEPLDTDYSTLQPGDIILRNGSIVRTTALPADELSQIPEAEDALAIIYRGASEDGPAMGISCFAMNNLTWDERNTWSEVFDGFDPRLPARMESGWHIPTYDEVEEITSDKDILAKVIRSSNQTGFFFSDTPDCWTDTEDEDDDSYAWEYVLDANEPAVALSSGKDGFLLVRVVRIFE